MSSLAKVINRHVVRDVMACAEYVHAQGAQVLRHTLQSRGSRQAGQISLFPAVRHARDRADARRGVQQHDRQRLRRVRQSGRGDRRHGGGRTHVRGTHRRRIAMQHHVRTVRGRTGISLLPTQR